MVEAKTIPLPPEVSSEIPLIWTKDDLHERTEKQIPGQLSETITITDRKRENSLASLTITDHEETIEELQGQLIGTLLYSHYQTYKSDRSGKLRITPQKNQARLFTISFDSLVDMTCRIQIGDHVVRFVTKEHEGEVQSGSLAEDGTFIPGPVIFALHELQSRYGGAGVALADVRTYIPDSQRFVY